jgi:hypothetical protein
MLREFMLPLFTLCACVIASIAGLDRLCLFHQTYQTMAAKLESERWLLTQCSDPHFFSKMHQHSDLCFQVENNARVGAFMLALRQLTQQSLLFPDALAGLAASFSSRFASWPFLCLVASLFLFAPSWLASTSASVRRWPDCGDGHFKNA